MDKLKDLMQKILNRVPATAPGAAMKYIMWYALFVVFCAVLYIIMLLSDWYISGRPNLSEMRQFLSVMVSGAAVAAIGFIARWLVDADGDGIPDAASEEKEGEKK